MESKTNTVDSQAENPTPPSRYVDALGLLEILFDADSRPSLRWLRDQQKARTIPYIRLGRRVFFDPPLVREVWNRKAIGRRGAVTS